MQIFLKSVGVFIITGILLAILFIPKTIGLSGFMKHAVILPNSLSVFIWTYFSFIIGMMPEQLTVEYIIFGTIFVTLVIIYLFSCSGNIKTAYTLIIIICYNSFFLAIYSFITFALRLVIKFVILSFKEKYYGKYYRNKKFLKIVWEEKSDR